MTKAYPNLIRARNTPNKVTLADGTIIERDKDGKIFIPEYGGFVVCCPYDNHFLFEVPKTIIAPSFLCSCGAPGVIVGSKEYSHLGSPQGMMLVCHHHLSFGKHADGSS
jgi:hypothetical protein